MSQIDASPAAAENLPPSSLIATAIFLTTEVMFFAGLLSAYLVLRAGAPDWPPENQPFLPITATALNTLTLIGSAVTINYAVRAAREGEHEDTFLWLMMTFGLGVIFLSIQGAEWVKLVGQGLTLSSSSYGATFYTLIGAHALHVAAAVIALLVLARRASFEKGRSLVNALEAGQLYWFFVVALWLVLFAVVYP